ncbi:MAG: hypothetical protein PVH19_11890 [Planctomycetia bacterium]|jgi:hypothetical protein
MLRCLILSSLLFATVSANEPASAKEPPAPEKFIVLSEFQVWADASGPECYDALKKIYLEGHRCHSFMLYPHYEYFVWDVKRMKGWVDEAVALKAFNVFCMGDDTRTAQGRLFEPKGLNPKLADTFFQIIEYAHEKGLMVSIEPVGLPKTRDKEHFKAWLETWLGPKVPKARRADIIKLSIEWFGAFGNSPTIAHDLEAFFEAAKEVNPDVLVYVDSIGGKWKNPQPLHRWLLSQYPGTIVSHYLNVDQVGKFREMGARNMMVQINPCEAKLGCPAHLFLYVHETIEFLKKAVKKRVRYVSLAGVNYAYNRRDFDIFLDVIRPHLNLAKDVETLRKSIVPDEIKEPVTKEEVKAELLEIRAKKKKRK